MPTISTDQQANNRALDFLQRFFEEHGLHVVRCSFNGFGSIVATTVKDTKTPKVMLTAHLDVVPGPSELFELREADGKYYGRGVYDMKFAIASYMHVCDQLQDALSDYDFGIMITTDEELGGLDGAEKLIELGYRPSVCVLPDGGQNWQLETLAKGFVFGDIEITGQTAHGSRPWEGDSATFRLTEALHELIQLFHGQAFETNSLNISMVHGGEAINQIPGTAQASLDIRYLTLKDYQAITEQLQQISAKHGAVYREKLRGAPGATDLQHPLVKPFVESITHITGREVSGTLSVGSSDARFFAEANIPCILTHPDGGGQHADDEWIDKTGFLQFGDVLVDYLQKVAGVNHIA